MSRRKGKEIRKEIKATKPKALLNRAEREKVQKDMRKSLEDIEKGVGTAVLEMFTKTSIVEPMAIGKQLEKLTEPQRKIYETARAEIGLIIIERINAGLGAEIDARTSQNIFTNIALDIAKKQDYYKKLKPIEEFAEGPFVIIGEKINVNRARKNVEITDKIIRKLEKSGERYQRQIARKLSIQQPLSEEDVKRTIKKYKEIGKIQEDAIKRARGMIIAKAVGNEAGAEKLKEQITKLSKEKDKIFKDLQDRRLKKGEHTGMEIA